MNLQLESTAIREARLRSEICSLYLRKKSIMTQTEQKAFYFLSGILNQPKYREYCIFPQVRLIDFYRLTPQAEAYEAIDKPYYDTIVRALSSKSVDFLICEKHHPSKYMTEYYPYMVIEIDGGVHYDSTVKHFEQIKKNDQFKDYFFEQLGLRFQRIYAPKTDQLNKEMFVKIVQENILPVTSDPVGQKLKS